VCDEHQSRQQLYQPGTDSSLPISLDFDLKRVEQALQTHAYGIGRRWEQDRLREQQEGQFIMEIKRALRVLGIRRDKYVL